MPDRVGPRSFRRASTLRRRSTRKTTTGGMVRWTRSGGSSSFKCGGWPVWPPGRFPVGCWAGALKHGGGAGRWRRGQAFQVPLEFLDLPAQRGDLRFQSGDASVAFLTTKT